ncbi:hypothetical protein ANN_23561 [Periplaneta americana]|uniref:Ig-like domain-containing protein n=1 Tax=Periplaneta americana TaxID=6978 RepID=A0ABQ8SMC8_PERAM|nr:hypothetical protein ANN_23561 [Periplaneta americana]
MTGLCEGGICDSDGEMSPESSAESYPTFALNELRENLGKPQPYNLSQLGFERGTALHGQVVVITEDVQSVHLLLEYRPHIDVSLTCERDPKLQEYCVCPQNMPQFDSEGIPNQAPETNKPMILNGPTSRNREGSDQAKQLGHLYLSIDQETFDPSTGEPVTLQRRYLRRIGYDGQAETLTTLHRFEGKQWSSYVSGGYGQGAGAGFNSLQPAGSPAPPPPPLPLGRNEPYFDTMTPRNVTALVGKSAYLSCRVRNLGNKTVSNSCVPDFCMRSISCVWFPKASKQPTTVYILKYYVGDTRPYYYSRRVEPRA